MEAYLGTIYIWAVRYAPEGFALCNGATYTIQQYNALYALFGTTYGGDGQVNFKIPNLLNRFPYGSVTGSGSGTQGAPNLQIGATGGTMALTTNVTATGTLAVSNLPGHTHPASFAPTTGSVQVTVTAPATAIPVTIPVVSNAASMSAPPNPLPASVYLAAAAAPSTLKGIYSTTAPVAGATSNLLGGTASGNPGGSFTGNVSTVTGGTVSVAAQNGAPTAFQAIAPVPLPPYLAMNFLLCTQGYYPVQP